VKWHVATGWRSQLIVDTLRLGIWLQFSARGLAILQVAKERADEERGTGPTEDEVAMLALGGHAERPGQVRVGAVACEVRRGHGFYDVILVTGDWSADFAVRKPKADEQRAPGCLVTFRSAALAEKGIAVVDEFLAFVEAFGEPTAVKVSRLDIALDVASSEPTLEWLRRDQLVTLAVTNRVRFAPEEDGAGPSYNVLLQGFGGTESLEQRSAMDVFEVEGVRERRRLSGVMVGTRGRDSAYLRIYDKELQSRKAQLAHVKPLWRRQGWDGVIGVLDDKGQRWGSMWRVEWELGRGWLLSYGLDTWADFKRIGLQAIWAHLTFSWLRIVQDERGSGIDSRGRELGVSRREKRDVVPFWAAVQAPARTADNRVVAGLTKAEEKPLRVTSSLMASAAGTLATLAAGKDWSMSEFAEAFFALGLAALRKVPEKLQRMSVDSQARLVPDANGEIKLSPDRIALMDLLLKHEQFADIGDETPF
jgi:hypothetical protein